MNDAEFIKNTIKHLNSKSERHIYNALVSVRTNLSKRKAEMGKLLEKGFITIIFKLLAEHEIQPKSSTEKSFADLIFSILGNLCMEESVRKQVLKCNGIEVTAKYFLECDSESIKNRSCRTLANLCLDQHSCTSICEVEDVLKTVVSQLNEAVNKDCVLTYCRAIRLFGLVSSNRKKLGEEQAYHAVAKLLKNEDFEVKKNAIRALYEMGSTCFGDEFTRQLNTANICKELLELTKTDESTTSQHASKTFLKLSTHSNLRPQLGAAGAVSDLHDLFKAENDLPKKCNFLSTLCLYCVEAVNRVRIRENGILLTILESLQCIDYKVVHDKVISALVCFLYDESSFQILLENRMIPILLSHFRQCGKFDISEVTEAYDEMNKSCEMWVSLQSNKADNECTLPLCQSEEEKNRKTEVGLKCSPPIKNEDVPSNIQINNGDVDNSGSELDSNRKVSASHIFKSEVSFDVSNVYTDIITQENDYIRIPSNIKKSPSLSGAGNTDGGDMSNLSENDMQFQQTAAGKTDDLSQVQEQEIGEDSNKRPFYSIDSPSYQEISGWSIDGQRHGATCKLRFSPSSSQLPTSPYSPLSAQSYYSPKDSSPAKRDTTWSYEWKTPELSPHQSPTSSSSPSGCSDGPTYSIDRSDSPCGKFEFDVYPPVGSLHYLCRSPVTDNLDTVEPVYSSSEDDEGSNMDEAKRPIAVNTNESHAIKSTAKRNLSLSLHGSSEVCTSAGIPSEESLTSNSNSNLSHINISKSASSSELVQNRSSEYERQHSFENFSKSTECLTTTIERENNMSTSMLLDSSSLGSVAQKSSKGSTSSTACPTLSSLNITEITPVSSATCCTPVATSSDSGTSDKLSTSDCRNFGCSETKVTKSIKQSVRQKILQKFNEPFDVKQTASLQRRGLKTFRDRSESPSDQSSRPSKIRKLDRSVAITKVTEDNILKIFSRLSNQEDPSKFIRETSLFVSLVFYAVKSSKPISRCGRILQRIVKNHNCFEHLMKISAPWVIYTYLYHAQATEMMNMEDTPSSELSTSPLSAISSQTDLFSSPFERRWSSELFKAGVENIFNSVELGRTLLRNLSFIAESYYGDGMIAKVHHRSSESERLRLYLNYPFMARTKDVIQKMIVTPKLHEKFISILQSDEAPDKLKEIILSGLSYMPDKLKVEYILLSDNLNLIFPQTITTMAQPVKNCSYNGSKPSHDLIFILDNEQRCSAKRDMLVKNSPLFTAMLEGHYCESHQSEVRIMDVSCGAFLYILHFLHGCKQHCEVIGAYSIDGTVKDVEEVLQILTLADRYLISTLHTYLLCLISTRYLKWENIPLIFSYALLHDYSTLADECIKRMLKSSDGTFHDRQLVFSELLKSSYRENVMEILNRLLFL